MTTTVLYVGGTGRSGSTVLANLLGEADGLVSVGEVRFLWERGIQEDRLCGCGEHFSQCPFWQDVLTVAYPQGPPAATAVIQRLQNRTRMRKLPGLLSGQRPSGDLAEVLDPLYRAIAEVAGARVVVDSSKLPTYAALLRTVPGLDVRMLHLVRDPRAAAFSWRRVKELPDKGSRTTMERRGIVKSASLWSVWNGALEYMWRDRPGAYYRMGYERFIDDPAVELRAAMAAFDLPGEPWSALTGPRSARVSTHHTVAGNPARLRQGSVTLRLDDEWLDSMPRRDQMAVEAVTAPLLRRYGYERQPTAPAPVS